MEQGFRVAQRTREIGLRIALGSAPSDILRRVLREGLWIGLSGIVIGVALTAALTQVLVGVLYGVKPLEPFALASSSVVLLAATLASVRPAGLASDADRPRRRFALGMRRQTARSEAAARQSGTMK